MVPVRLCGIGALQLPRTFSMSRFENHSLFSCLPIYLVKFPIFPPVNLLKALFSTLHYLWISWIEQGQQKKEKKNPQKWISVYMKIKNCTLYKNIFNSLKWHQPLSKFLSSMFIFFKYENFRKLHGNQRTSTRMGWWFPHDFLESDASNACAFAINGLHFLYKHWIDVSGFSIQKFDNVSEIELLVNFTL